MAHNRYLAIETSSPRLSLALGDSKKVMATLAGAHDWRHAESVFAGIKKLLKQARWSVQSLSGVAVSTGPGSFTGIRIGLAVARTLGQSLKIPVVGVSSLEIMAAGAKTRALWRAPQIDALRGHVFAALYETTSGVALRRVLSERMVPAKDWPRLALRHAQGKPLWLPKLHTCFPEAGVLLELAGNLLDQASPTSYKSVFPLYIRQAAAEERRR